MFHSPPPGRLIVTLDGRHFSRTLGFSLHLNMEKKSDQKKKTTRKRGSQVSWFLSYHDWFFQLPFMMVCLITMMVLSITMYNLMVFNYQQIHQCRHISTTCVMRAKNQNPKIQDQQNLDFGNMGFPNSHHPQTKVTTSDTLLGRFCSCNRLLFAGEMSSNVVGFARIQEYRNRMKLICTYLYVYVTYIDLTPLCGVCVCVCACITKICPIVVSYSTYNYSIPVVQCFTKYI